MSDPDENEVQYYRDTLEAGLQLICDAFGVSSEHYDRDQADGECYLDCFRDAAEQIAKAGIQWNPDECEFVTAPPTHPQENPESQ